MSNHLLLATGTALALLITACTQAERNAQERAPTQNSSTIQAPQSIAAEHHHIHELLAAASRDTGALGEAARKLEAVLGPHFEREEEIATPPLGLLPQLAKGPATAEMRSVLPMTDALEAEHAQMIEEHKAISAANAALREAAIAARRDDIVGFCDTLAAHARQEEEILYPAAILVGRHVKATAPR